jgi:hypothetical protein
MIYVQASFILGFVLDFVVMKRLTTADVADRLNVAQVTVNVWCLRGKFPNAAREETPRGPVWTIPETDLVGFVKPTPGRPPKPTVMEKRAIGQKNASNGPSSKKKGSKK